MGMSLPPPEQGLPPALPTPPTPPTPPAPPVMAPPTMLPPSPTLPPPPGAGPPPPPPPGWAPTLPPGYPPAARPRIDQLAGFWIRFASWVLDYILYGLLFAVFAIPSIVLFVSAFDGCKSITKKSDDTIHLLCPPDKPAAWPIVAGVALALIGIVLVMVIYVRALGKGQTWGMRICNIRLVRADNGEPTGFAKAFGRTLFAGLISAQIFYLGYLWAAWDDQKQTWQDKVVSTYVVRA